MRLLTEAGNPQAWKALVAAQYAGVKVDVAETTVEQHGRLPILETPEGTLTEPNSIARHIVRSGKSNLYGNSVFDSASIDNWIEWAANEVELPGAVWTLPILGVIPNHAQATTKAKADVRRSLETLNKHLQTRTFLVGDRLSLADIVVACGLHRLYTLVLDNGFRKSFQNTNRWFVTVVNQPNFLAVAGNTVLCEKMQVAKETAEVKEEKPKVEKKKEEPKKQEKKKEEKPKEQEEEEEEPEAAERKEKKPNPLDLLPPSKFNLEDWKRVYSNEDTRTVAMPWFWEHFDPEGFSVYFADYKYPNELDVVFKTCNLVGGFIQRMEGVRKYCFASILIFGNDGNLAISGCFVFRGKEVPQIAFEECPDMDSYEWKKADINDPATKELIADYFSWSGNFGGKTLPFNQGKNLK